MHFWYGVDRRLQYPGEKIILGFYGWVMVWNMGDTDSTKEWKKALLDYTRSHLGVSITISPFFGNHFEFQCPIIFDRINWEWETGKLDRQKFCMTG